MMTQPDVALTDYALAVECALFAYLLYPQREPREPLRHWFVLFFGSTAIAALAGGTVHGFFLEEKTTGYLVLWPAALIAVGIVALASWAIGATLLFPAAAVRWIAAAAALEFAGYVLVVLLVSQEFRVAIINYLPPALFLLISFLIVYRRTRKQSLRAGLLGTALALFASALQQAGISLHPVYLDHNALYHLTQAVALLLIFYAARRLITEGLLEGGRHADASKIS